MVTQPINCIGHLVLLLFRGKAAALIHHKLALISRLFALFGFGDRGDKINPPALRKDFLRGLSVFIQLPVTGWIFIG